MGGRRPEPRPRSSSACAPSHRRAGKRPPPRHRGGRSKPSSKYPHASWLAVRSACRTCAPCRFERGEAERRGDLKYRPSIVNGRRGLGIYQMCTRRQPGAAPFSQTIRGPASTRCIGRSPLSRPSGCPAGASGPLLTGRRSRSPRLRIDNRSHRSADGSPTTFAAQPEFPALDDGDPIVQCARGIGPGSRKSATEPLESAPAALSA